MEVRGFSVGYASSLPSVIYCKLEAFATVDRLK